MIIIILGQNSEKPTHAMSRDSPSVWVEPDTIVPLRGWWEFETNVRLGGKKKRERGREGERKERKRERGGAEVCGTRAVLPHSSFKSWSNASFNLGVTEAGWLPLLEVTFSWQLQEMTSWADTHPWLHFFSATSLSPALKLTPLIFKRGEAKRRESAVCVRRKLIFLF